MYYAKISDDSRVIGVLRTSIAPGPDWVQFDDAPGLGWVYADGVLQIPANAQPSDDAIVEDMIADRIDASPIEKALYLVISDMWAEVKGIPLATARAQVRSRIKTLILDDRG